MITDDYVDKLYAEIYKKDAEIARLNQFMRDLPTGHNIMEPKLSLDEAKSVVATKTAPRVTEESIKAKIVDVSYLMPEIVNDFDSDDMTTICKIRMENGFVFIGHSTPASKANFDAEVGKRYAYDNAFKQIWTHEGYLLRETLSRYSPDAKTEPKTNGETKCPT